MEKRTIEILVPVCDCCGAESWNNVHFLVREGRSLLLCDNCNEGEVDLTKVAKKPAPRKAGPRKAKAEEKPAEEKPAEEKPAEPVNIARSPRATHAKKKPKIEVLGTED
jgi:ribosome-binding protein aMBF1 (putative translation factor)